MSWIGETATVSNFLKQVGADKVEEKGYRLSEGFVVFGLGGEEVVIPDDIQYYIAGKGHFLAEDLLTMGQGIAVRML